jgi:hypothetical protein
VSVVLKELSFCLYYHLRRSIYEKDGKITQILVNSGKGIMPRTEEFCPLIQDLDE